MEMKSIKFIVIITTIPKSARWHCIMPYYPINDPFLLYPQASDKQFNIRQIDTAVINR